MTLSNRRPLSFLDLSSGIDPSLSTSPAAPGRRHGDLQEAALFSRQDRHRLVSAASVQFRSLRFLAICSILSRRPQ